MAFQSILHVILTNWPFLFALLTLFINLNRASLSFPLVQIVLILQGLGQNTTPPWSFYDFLK